MIRVTTALAVAVAAVVHLWLWWDGYRNVAVLGPGFLLNGIGGLVIAVAVLSWRHWLPGILAAGFGMLTLGSFVLATTVGFFGVRSRLEGAPEWISAITEAIAIVGGLVLAWRHRPNRTQAVTSA